MNRDLLITARQLAVLPSHLIPTVGFGTRMVVQETPLGPLLEIQRQFAYQMSCGCKVTKPDELGGVCRFCWQELTQILEQMGASMPVEQMEFMCSPCKNHWHPVCKAPFCSAGGCSKHMALGPDGRMYCAEHFVALADSLEFREMEERHGFLFPRLARFFRSLFFTGK